MKSDLVYDVGLHRGEDTDFYLKKGFDVLAIEANVELVADARRRFQVAIEDAKLEIIEGAIAHPQPGSTVVFYTSPQQSEWGTIQSNWAARNEMLTHDAASCTEVRRIDIADVYRSKGIPFYLKIDIEGMDCLVVQQLEAFADRPQYISLESNKVDFHQLAAEFALLKRLGYRKFKVVQQQTIPGTLLKTRTLDGRPLEYVFQPHASGPFGDDLPPPWLSYEAALDAYEQIFRRYRYFGDNSPILHLPDTVQRLMHRLYRAGTGYRGPLPGWFDTHASL